ncbi:hypothetical protein FSP39_006430, partial [Pinctada imbricata]
RALEESSDSSSAGSSRSSLESGDENTVRGNWSGRLDFLLSCIGYAVGLGNIWRFPYLCYQSGGGAFLIPYVIFLVLCGIPLFFMEVSYGQFASLSPITVWRICPLFKGVGYGMVIISGIVCVYYNIIITWTIYFLYKSFRAVLPWSTCNNEWNTEHCYMRRQLSNVNGTNTSQILDFVNGSTALNYTVNSSLVVPAAENVGLRKTASEEFWQNHVLQITDGIENVGGIRWELLICLAIAWILVFLCLCKGVKSSGKVVYVTATFPYLVLMILLVRGATLPGAAEGIKFYLVPDWEKLFTFKVWGDAAVQIFYSVGMAWGGLVTMASYNKFRNNVYRDALMVPLINCGTSVFAGLVIFSVLGFMSYETGVPIDKVVTQGPGLTFVAYPEAVARLPVSPLWAVLFFLMLFTIGLDSQFGMFETMTSAFVDEFPEYLKNKKVRFTAFVCFIEFLLGIPCVLEGGMYILQIMDWYCATFSLMLLSLTECVVIAWVYGVDRFYKDIELMIGYQPNIWWKICWRFITPFTIVFIWLFSVTQLSPVTYGDYQYPGWAIAFGWLLGMASIVPLPVCAIIAICKEDGPILERVKKLLKPSIEWGPAVPKYREEYLASLDTYDQPPPYLHVETNPSANVAFLPSVGQSASTIVFQSNEKMGFNSIMADLSEEVCRLPSFGQFLVTKLHELFSDEQLCDFEVHVEGSVFKVHKVVMASSSDYFRAMFSHDMLENRQEFMEMKGITAKGFRPLMEFAYSGELKLNLDNIHDVMNAATFLQILPAIDMCTQYLRDKLSFDNAEELLKIAEVFSIPDLKTYYREYILKNFLQFALTDNFLKLDSHTLADYLSDDGLNTTSECLLLHFVIKWYEHDTKGRYSSAFEVFDKVRYVVDGWPAIHFAMHSDPFTNNETLKPILKFADDYMTNPETRYLINDHRSRVRSTTKTIIQFGGKMKHSFDMDDFDFPGLMPEDSCGWNKNHFYNPEMKKWVPAGPAQIMEYGLSHATLTEINDNAILCGGYCYNMEGTSYIDVNPTKTTWMFGPNHLSMWKLAPLKHERARHAAAYAKGCLYVIGGRDNKQSLSSVEKLDCKSNTWSYVRPIPQALNSHCAVTYKDKIYISGGIDGYNATNKVWRYDPAMNKWRKRMSMLEARANHCMVVHDDSIYVFGGHGDLRLDETVLKSVEIFCLKEDGAPWRQGAKMFLGVQQGAAVVFKEKILVLGGTDSEYELTLTIQQYDPVTNVWSVYGTLPRPLKGLACCVVTCKLSKDGEEETDEILQQWKDNIDQAEDNQFMMFHADNYDDDEDDYDDDDDFDDFMF